MASSSDTMAATRDSGEMPPTGLGLEESLTSKPIVFIVGPEQREFHIHKNLVAQTSPVLNALVNGRMREAIEGRVNWPEVDVDTFLRFARFVYTQDYAEAEPEILVVGDQQVPETQSRGSIKQEPGNNKGNQSNRDGEGDESNNGGARSENPGGNPTSDQTPAMDLPTTLPYSIISYCDAVNVLNRSARGLGDDDDDVDNRRKRRRLLKACVDFLDNNYLPIELQYAHRYMQMSRCLFTFLLPGIPLLPPTYSPDLPERELIPKSALSWTPRPNTGAHESYGPVFLSHARLYLLADKYKMATLKTLTMYRLHQTLMKFQFYPESTPDIISLAREIYDNTPESDPSRLLVALYIGCFVEHIRKRDDFRKFVSEGGELVRDIFEEVATRLDITSMG